MNTDVTSNKNKSNEAFIAFVTESKLTDKTLMQLSVDSEEAMKLMKLLLEKIIDPIPDESFWDFHARRKAAAKWVFQLLQMTGMMDSPELVSIQNKYPQTMSLLGLWPYTDSRHPAFGGDLFLHISDNDFGPIKAHFELHPKIKNDRSLYYIRDGHSGVYFTKHAMAMLSMSNWRTTAGIELAKTALHIWADWPIENYVQPQ